MTKRIEPTSSTGIMIDFETLALGTLPPVISLSAVRFKVDALCHREPPFERTRAEFAELDNIHIGVDPGDCIDTYGAKLDKGTLAWWMEQDDAARAEQVTLIRNALPMNTALLRLVDFVSGKIATCTGPAEEDISWSHGAGTDEMYAARIDGGPTVWSKGSTFDIAILERYFELAGIREPWHYRNVMDVRTIERQAWITGPKYPSLDLAALGTRYHSALGDCWAQIDRVQRAHHRIQNAITAAETAGQLNVHTPPPKENK